MYIYIYIYISIYHYIQYINIYIYKYIYIKVNVLSVVKVTPHSIWARTNYIGQVLPHHIGAAEIRPGPWCVCFCLWSK